MRGVGSMIMETEQLVIHQPEELGKPGYNPSSTLKPESMGLAVRGSGRPTSEVSWLKQQGGGQLTVLY